MSMLNESDWYVGESDYDPPRPANEECDRAPAEFAPHSPDARGYCRFCKREVEEASNG